MADLSDNQRAVVERQLQQGIDAETTLQRIATTCPECGHGSNILKEREQQIIREALEWLSERTGANDDHVATRFLARLAEVRDLSNALGFRAKKAGEARAKLYGAKTGE